MAKPENVRCFTCGETLGSEPRLHLLPSGEPCPACRDRLLESIPPALPREAFGNGILDPYLPHHEGEGEAFGAAYPRDDEPEGPRGA